MERSIDPVWANCHAVHPSEPFDGDFALCLEALHLILMQAPSWTYRLSGRQDVSANTHLIPGGNHALASLA